MMSAQDFAGFTSETFAFLRGLAANNNKTWFDAHRVEYQRFYVEPALAFVSELGPRLKQIAPDVQFEPRINGSLFRVNRDVRFALDKTPYKPHIDLWFWYGAGKGWDKPGFFLRLLPEELIVGAGLHKFTPSQLTAYREALSGPSGAELAELLGSIGTVGRYAMGEPELAKLPRGIAMPVEREGLARRTSLHAMYQGPVPPQAAASGFVDWCLALYRDLAPINEWLVEAAVQ